MFTESAALYDAIYAGFKDYAHETEQIAALLHAAHPGARTVLDVACGTGEHAQRLAAQGTLSVDGLDLDPGMLSIARRKHPTGRFFEADMGNFALGRRYDVVMCLFSSIAYLVTLERVSLALVCFRNHLATDGIIVVEPWLAPGVLDPAYVSRTVADVGALRVERVSHTEIEGRVSRLRFDYSVEGPDGVRHETELHELGLFTPEEMLQTFEQAGLAANYDPVGLTGRGLYVARAAA